MALKIPRLTGFRLALLITCLLAAFYYFLGERFTLFQTFELKTLDLKFSLRGTSEPPGDVVIVAIDDYSIDRLGRWPWPRSYHAELVDLLTLDGAKVIGFDLILSEPENTPELATMRQLKQYFKTLSISGGNPEGEEFGRILEEVLEASSNDRIFSESIARNQNVIIALVFQDFGPPGEAPPEELFGGDEPPEELLGGDDPPEELWGDDEPSEELLGGDEPPAELWDDEPPEEFLGGGDEQLNDDMLVPSEVKESAIVSDALSDGWADVPQAQELLLPITEFYTSAKDLGHVNTFPDIDGNLRWAGLVLGYAGRYYPALGIKMLQEYYGLGDEDMKIIQGKGILLGKRQVPLDEQGRMMLNYYGPDRSFKYYPYADILEGELPQGTFRDKIVLVGYAATGLGDVWTTPFSRGMPGVEKHATVIGNVLDGKYLGKSARVVDVMFIVVVGLVLGYCLPRMSPLRVALFALVTIAAALVVSFLCFYFFNLWVSSIYPVLNGILVSAAVGTFKFFTEEKEKRLVKKAFKQYLSPDLVEELVKNPEGLRLGGEKKELTVFFSDIRDFTSISEQLSPDRLVALLNNYLSAMTGIIMDNKGLVDKFIGDAIMAVYGAPIHFQEHPQMACTTAVKMIKEVKRLSPLWKEQGYPDINIGVGINTGLMIAGNMGSEDRFDYTVMGDSVNLASRLEGLCKAYGASIIISEFTASRVEGFTLRELDLVRVKGRAEPVRIYEVVGFERDCEALADELRMYREALEIYRSMQWSPAAKAFGRLKNESDAKLYKLYMERCMGFLDSPPPPGWDGVFTFTEK